jgi:hypothetical protein
MVLVGARVVAHRARRAGDAAHEPELLEQLERRVHGRQRHARQRPADLGEHALRGRVAVELAQRAGDRQPLRRHALPALAQGGRESGVHGVRHAWKDSASVRFA